MVIQWQLYVQVWISGFSRLLLEYGDAATSARRIFKD
jgi:hypothetical protein